MSSSLESDRPAIRMRMREIKSSIATTNVAFNKITFFHQEIEFKFKEDASKLLGFEHRFVWC